MFLFKFWWTNLHGWMNWINKNSCGGWDLETIIKGTAWKQEQVYSNRPIRTRQLCRCWRTEEPLQRFEKRKDLYYGRGENNSSIKPKNSYNGRSFNERTSLSALFRAKLALKHSRDYVQSTLISSYILTKVLINNIFIVKELYQPATS